MSKGKRNNAAVDEKSNRIGTWLMQMAAVAAISVAGYHATMGSNDAEASVGGSGATSIVVIDTQRLLEAKTEQAIKMVSEGAEMTKEEVEMQGHMFGTLLLKTLKAYRDQGIIVLDRRHALAIPPEYDVTDEVGEQMGLTLKPFDDPFSAPSLK